MKLWCFDDAHYWGTSLAEAAQKRGHEVSIFETVKDVGVAEGVLFYHMHHHPAVRDHHKRAMAQFATMPALTLIPSYRASVLYDDRIEQLRAFGGWMPFTVVFRSPKMAHEYLNAVPDLPIVSKSHIGPGTRFLETLDDARKEIKHAFSDIGVKNRYDVYHHGALFWQQHLPNDGTTFRVLIIGSQAMVEKRSGQNLIAVREETDDVMHVIAMARAIAASQSIRFAGFDFIRSDGDWFLMKMVAGWSMRRYVNARFFPDLRTGAEFWEVMVDEIEKGNLS